MGRLAHGAELLLTGLPGQNLLDHAPNFLLGEFRIHRQRENTGRRFLGDRQRIHPRRMSPWEALLLMNRYRVMGQGRDAFRRQVGLQRIPAFALDDIKMVNMLITCRSERQGHSSFT